MVDVSQHASMNLEEEFEQIAVADPARVENDLDCHGVAPIIAVRGIDHIAT